MRKLTRSLLTYAVAGILTAALSIQSTASGELVASAEQQEEGQSAILLEGSVDSCALDGAGRIQITGNSTGDTAGTDGQVYLFELRPYEEHIGERTDYLEKTAAQTAYSFSIPASNLTERLYNRFVPAVYDGERYLEIGAARYISNPEAAAVNTQPYNVPLTKKGLNVELHMLDDAFSLGVKHASVNIAFSMILGGDYPFTYEGKTYYFNRYIIADYDNMISALSAKDISVTAILLNDWNPAALQLIPEGTEKTSSANYYMFNIETQEGFETTRAIAAFLAQHYDGSNPDAGKISNWVIGNEVNNQEWNYVGEKDLESYVRQYQEAFRVFYTAIRSRNANDRVYFSLDYYWYAMNDDKLRYRGRDFLDAFQKLADEEGALDWNLAWHPYPDPLTEPEFWDDEASGMVTQTYETPVMNFANLSVLTDYLSQPQFLTDSGEVRSVILTEQGFTSHSLSRGDVSRIQAAAFAYSYYLVDSNPHIDAYILTRQVDAPEAVNLGLSMGLWGCDMNYPNQMIPKGRKKIWEVFLKIDKEEQSLEVSEFAKQIIGIEKWGDVVPNFRWKNKE